MMASLPRPRLCGLQCAAVPSVHKDIGCGEGQGPWCPAPHRGWPASHGELPDPLASAWQQAPTLSPSWSLCWSSDSFLLELFHPPLVLGPPSDRRLCAQGFGYILVELSSSRAPGEGSAADTAGLWF